MKSFSFFFASAVSLFICVDTLLLLGILFSGQPLHPQLQQHFLTNAVVLAIAWGQYSYFYPSKR